MSWANNNNNRCTNVECSKNRKAASGAFFRTGDGRHSRLGVCTAVQGCRCGVYICTRYQRHTKGLVLHIIASVSAVCCCGCAVASWGRAHGSVRCERTQRTLAVKESCSGIRELGYWSAEQLSERAIRLKRAGAFGGPAADPAWFVAGRKRPLAVQCTTHKSSVTLRQPKHYCSSPVPAGPPQRQVHPSSRRRCVPSLAAAPATGCGHPAPCRSLLALPAP